MSYSKTFYSSILALMILLGVIAPIRANSSDIALTRKHLNQLHRVRNIMRTEKYRQALKRLSRLLNTKLPPNLDAHLRILQGVALEKLGKFDMAKDIYQKIIGNNHVREKVRGKMFEHVYRSKKTEKTNTSLDDKLAIIDAGILVARARVNRKINLERLKPETIELVGINSNQTFTHDAVLNRSYVFLRVPFADYTFRTKSDCMISTRHRPYNRSANRIELSGDQTFRKVTVNIAEVAVVSPCGTPEGDPNNDEFTIPDLKLSLPTDKNGAFLQEYLPVQIALIDIPEPRFRVYRWKYTFDPDDPSAEKHLNEEGVLNIPPFKGSGYSRWKSHMGEHPTYEVQFGDTEHRSDRRMSIPLYRKRKQNSD